MIAGIAFSAFAVATVAAESTNSNSFASPSNRVSRKVVKASELIGRDVRGTANKRLGKIDDLVVDLESGRVLYMVVRADGFLSERRFAVPASAFQSEAGQWQINADKQKLTSAPQLTRDQEANLGNAGFVNNTFRYFNQHGWWGGPDVRFNNVHKFSSLVGMDVKDLADEKIGGVNDLAIDVSDNRVLCAIVSHPAASGRGSTLCAMPPNALTPSADRQSLSTSIDRAKLASAPHFTKDQWPDMTDPAWPAQLYQYYGKQAYFDSGELRATGRTNTNTQPRIYHEPGEPKK